MLDGLPPDMKTRRHSIYQRRAEIEKNFMMKSSINRLLLAATLCVLAALILFPPALSHTTHAQEAASVKGNFVEGELLVRFKPGTSAKSMRAVHSTLGASKVRDFDFINWQHVRLPKGMSVDEGIAAYRRLASVSDVQPNYIYRLDVTPNDPRFGSLYGMNKISAPTAWDTNTGSASVVVAIIDSGVAYNHEDLSPNMWHNPGEIAGNGIDDDGNGYVDDVYGIDAINNDSDPIGDLDHGTHVAGTIGAAGNNAKGVTGVNWNVRLMALKSHDASGNGTAASVLQCFQYATMMKRRGINIRVTNNSWGGAPEAAGYDQALKDAIDAAGNAGILNAFAAGNDASNNDAVPSYPASYNSPSIIAVASSDSTDNRSSFSSYGATSVDLAAPGSSILSTVNSSTTAYGTKSGTSMATPHVAGAAALLSAYDPTLSVASLKATLMNTVDVLPQWAGKVVSGGRLNVAQAQTLRTVCTYALNATNQAFSASGGNGSVTVTTLANCGWFATSDTNFVTLNANAVNTTSGTFTFTVAPNPNATSRTAIIRIGDQAFTVSQGGTQPPAQINAGDALISEFRFDGPNGDADAFVELYNNTEQSITVFSNDGSSGWAVVAANRAGGTCNSTDPNCPPPDKYAFCTIPNNTVIPARGHFLCANSSGYGLQNYGGSNKAMGDATGTTRLGGDAGGEPFDGLALSRSATNFTPANWLDAVGSADATLREGQPLPYQYDFNSTAQYSIARRLANGRPQDTGDNAADFVLVSTTGAVGSTTAMLGTPAPENLASPRENLNLVPSFIDPTVASSLPPNRVRQFCGEAGAPACPADANTSPNGYLSIRRKFTNNTGANVTRLRLRVYDITTLNTPVAIAPQADFRAINSADVNATTGLGNVLVRGTTLESLPAQTLGGGFNSSLSVDSVSLATPLAPNAAINVQLLLGVVQSGRFRFFVYVEALP
jgi:subtilisin family serine protease